MLEAANWKDGFVGYPHVQPAEVPFVPFLKPLNQTRLAVVSTAGLYLTHQQAPFTAADVEGDVGLRELPADVKAANLSIAHTHYPHAAAEADWNAVLPLDHLRAMVTAGELGSLGPIFSISGYCTNAAALCRTSAEVIAAAARSDGCDAMLLVPV
ncbi:MAG TPA: glycine/sarcosine/betaine reductase selenoprotein B family protein [Symbiobacteriaceae bacterium]